MLHDPYTAAALADSEKMLESNAFGAVDPAPVVLPSSAAAVVRFDLPLTEVGLAERLIARHGADLRYSHARAKWLVWQGTRWAWDEFGVVERRLKETIRAIYAAVPHLPEGERERFAKYAIKSESDKVIRAAINRARVEDGVSIALDSLDADPWLLNTQTATVDLRNGEARPHRREDLLTMQTATPFEAGARAERFGRFLEEVFPQDPILREFIMRALGYSLTGSTREEKFLILHGRGRNGKGTLIGTFQAGMGDYAAAADFSTFTRRADDGQAREDLAALRGKRLVVANEGREGGRLNETVIKTMTGGDRIRARHLYENSAEYQPAFKLWLASNFKPEIDGGDPAIWARVLLVPFDVSFAGNEDTGLKAALQSEGAGVLNWAIEGALRWQEDGLNPPTVVSMAVADYRAESDVVNRFLEECTDRLENARVPVRKLYGRYVDWARGTGEESMAERRFTQRVRLAGIKRERGRDANYFAGLAIKSQFQGGGDDE